jgi:SnoaL-like protein
VRYDEVRELLVRQWTYTGGPNEAKGSEELYHDDAVLEFPQSGERFVGKANIDGWRQQYPARLDFEPRELRGAGDLWVAETGLRYDGGEPVHVVKILQFRGDKVERETLYFAESFPAPDWRRPWADEHATWEPRGDLPARIRAGS